MQELALVKLTKSLAKKVGEKVTAKKQKWAEEAAISVEENKRREAEFKEDFKHLKKSVGEGSKKAVAATTKAVEGLQTKGVKAEDVAKKPEKKLDTANKEIPKVKAVESKSAKKVDVSAKPAVKKAITKDNKESQAKTVSNSEVKKVSSAQKVETKTAKKEAVTKPTATKNVKLAVKTEKKVSTKKEETKASETPSKKEVKLALYSEDIKKHYGKVDEDFLAIVVKNLGPSIYKKDAELVSCSDPKELETVRKNFLMKKLEMTENSEVLDASIKEVCDELKASRRKYRATFYYALAKKLKKESKLS